MVFAFSWICFHYESENVWDLLPGLFAFTGAQPILISQSISLGLSMVPQDQLGSMSGLMTTIQQFAQALGLAFLLAIFMTLELTTHSTFSAFLGLNLTALAFALIGLFVALTKIRAEKL